MKPYVTFIIPPYHKRQGSGSVFPLGIGYLISVLHEYGYESKLINLAKEMDDIFTEISEDAISNIIQNKISELKKNGEPLFWGIGPVTTTSAGFLKSIVVTLRKKSNKPIICGGPLPSIVGQRWLFFDYLSVDAIVMGDGEEVIVRIVDCLTNGKELCDCDGVVTPQKDDCINYLSDIDSIPIPYRLPVDASVRRSIVCPPTAAMITMRGCPYSCPFCVSGNLRGKGKKKFLKRSLDSIVSELVLLQNDGYRSVLFYDDCLFWGNNVNEKIYEFCYALESAKISLEWTMELRPDAFEQLTKYSFNILAKNGCKEINIGFETTNRKVQSSFNKCFNTISIAQCCKNGIEAGIAINGTFIIGGPNESIDSIRNTISASMELGLLFAHYTPLEIYPGTPLYASLFPYDDKAWFFILSKDDLKWNEFIYGTDNIPSNELIKLAMEAYKIFYSRLKWEEMINTFFDADESKRIILSCRKMIENRYNL